MPLTKNKWKAVKPCGSSRGCLPGCGDSRWNHLSPNRLMSWTSTAGCTETPPSRCCLPPPANEININYLCQVCWARQVFCLFVCLSVCLSSVCLQMHRKKLLIRNCRLGRNMCNGAPWWSHFSDLWPWPLTLIFDLGSWNWWQRAGLARLRHGLIINYFGI